MNNKNDQRLVLPVLTDTDVRRIVNWYHNNLVFHTVGCLYLAGELGPRVDIKAYDVYKECSKDKGLGGDQRRHNWGE